MIRFFSTLLMLCSLHLVAADAPAPLTLEPGTLELGEVDGETEITRQVVAHAAEQLTIKRLLSTCPCVSLGASRELPARLAAGDAMTITVTIDPTSYEGSFSKITFVEAQADTASKATMIRLDVKGTITLDDGWGDVGEEAPPATAKSPSPEPIPYEAGMALDDLKQHLVFFLTPNCDRCNWVRLLWLPRYYQAHPEAKVYTADVTTETGLDLLLQFEQAAPPAEKGDAPVAWYQGHLHYGTQAIGNLLE